MKTPICDFVEQYAREGNLRLHMPGHKGIPFLGVEDRDITEVEGRMSLTSKMGDVIGTFRGKLLFARLMAKMLGGKKKGGPKKAAGFDVTPEMMSMMNGFTVLRLLTMMGGFMDVKFTKEDLLKLNAKLNKIKKP